ncbi:hypothetical protein E4T56_gene6878 [Termitomyces sp. T112]|nr:hypothetical protein E4T56_gene6878 [Termitomyces sp. T112]
MRWSPQTCLCAILLLIVPHIQAIHQSDVGVVDWHKFLVGVPLVAAPVTAPSFHRLNFVANSTEKPIDGAEIIYAATANNVITALNPKDGSVVWRYIFEADDRILGYYPHLNRLATLSGPGGAIFRVFDGITGALYSEKRLHAPESGRNAEPLHLGAHVAFGNSGESYVLTNGHVVRRVDALTGIVQWTWASEDGLTVLTNLVSTSSALYAVAFTRSSTTLNLHVIVLDPRTGSVIHSRGVPSSIKHTYTILSNSTSETDHPHVAWIENGLLRSFKLTPELDAKPDIPVHKTRAITTYERIIDVGLSLSGSAVAVASDGSATLLSLNGDNMEGIEALLLDNSNPEKNDEEITESTWIGSLGENPGEVIVGQVYRSHKINKIKLQTLISTSVSGAHPKLNSADFEIAFDIRAHGIIVHAALSCSASTHPSTLLLTTTSGTVQSWELASDSTELWTREEALASIVLSEFIQLPEGQSNGGVTARNEGEDFFGRLWRHNFPRYLHGFLRRFLTGSYASTTSVSASSPASFAERSLIRDTFGLTQIIVVATVQGKIFGIDSSTGRIVWSRILGLGWAAEVGASVVPVKMFVFQSEDATGEQEARGPEVIIVAQRRAENTLVDTVIFHINAITGASATNVDTSIPQEDSNGLLQGFDVVPGPVVEAYLLSPPVGSPKKYATSVLLLDEFLQVYLYPSTPYTRATLHDLQPSLHFPLRTNADGVARVLGHSIAPHYAGEHGAEGHDGERGFVAYATWTLGLPPDEVVKTMIPQIHGPVASLGKVLGNRTTLYKYLNPSLFVLLTAPAPATATTKKGRTCGLYVVDGVKGTIVYHASLPTLPSKKKATSKDSCDVKAELVENWLIYQYYDPDWTGVGLSKGWRLVSVELYEGSGIDEKTRSSDMTSFANDTIHVHAYEQAYLLPHAITAFAPTSTKFGITVKDLIIASRTHQIASIQRHLLNPRRPHRKVTAQEQEEFLVSHEPVLASDPRRVLSHTYEVANVQRIVTSPTLLESTSLVFAYGLDLFLTRVAPSNTFDVLNENFNKAQLVLTVSGLALAIIITRPMVQRKKLREKWYH